jgi:hypothetical protein
MFVRTVILILSLIWFYITIGVAMEHGWMFLAPLTWALISLYISTKEV